MSPSTSATRNRRRRRRTIAVLALAVGVASCGSPNLSNIALRKQNQSLQNDVSSLQREHTGDLASIAALQQKNPSVALLSHDRLDQLFTVHGLSLGALTSGDNPKPDATADSQLLVYAVPTDDDGDPIKAAGSFDVQAYDLAEPAHALVGRWAFSTAQTRSHFFSHVALYTYVLPCPWQSIPRHAKLTVRVSFRDELTGRTFSAERGAAVRPPV